MIFASYIHIASYHALLYFTSYVAIFTCFAFLNNVYPDDMHMHSTVSLIGMHSQPFDYIARTFA